MNEQESINYHPIAAAINYIQTNFKDQPNLEEVAEKVHLNPLHFKRLFTEWAGTSPQKFLQYTSIEYAKKLLKENQATLFETAHEKGLSGTRRLHDLFIKIEGMTPAEYKNCGKNLSINYSFADSLFGNILIASTSKGICHLAFVENEFQAFGMLQNRFPNANFKQHLDLIQQNALFIFSDDWQKLNQIKLHLKCTDFQLKVWETLLKIPMGQLSTYGSIAKHISNPNASRAVGTAIGDNPIAFLIPCHRVIQSTGKWGGYMWGTARKIVIIGWEATKVNIEQET